MPSKEDIAFYLSIISVIIALFGGASGIIDLIDYFNKRPILKVRLTSWITSSMHDAKGQPIPKSMIMVGMTLVNYGARPSFPHVWSGEFLISSEHAEPVWYRGSNFKIPDDASFTNA